MRGRLPVVGTYTGDGAVQSFKVGFRPKMVLILNITDGDIAHIHLDGMTDDTSVDIAAAVAGNAADAVTLNSLGFNVGTDASESAKVYRYIAF